MLVGEKMKEISTTISYHKDKRPAKFTTSCGGNYCVPKWENNSTKLKMVSNQILKLFFFTSLKVLAVESIGYRAYEIWQKRRS